MGESLLIFAGLLPPLEAPDDDEDDDVVEQSEREPSWPEIQFELMWTQHGGSGLGLTYADIEELDIGDALRLSAAVIKRRRREAEALKRAAKVPRGR